MLRDNQSPLESLSRAGFLLLNKQSLLWYLDHSFERNKCRRRLSIARREVAVEIETALARRARVTARTSSHTEWNCVRRRSSAVTEIDCLHERIRFDEDLISTAYVSVRRLQIKNFICGGVSTRGKNRGVQATFRINALARETQFVVLRESSATSYIRSGSGQVEG